MRGLHGTRFVSIVVPSPRTSSGRIVRMPNPGPLAGIRVIDFGRFIAGPYCGMLLADMGADVIRVDRRQGSEDRYIAPITKSGEGGGFLSLNRNKRSLTLDTSKPASAEIIQRLVKST